MSDQQNQALTKPLLYFVDDEEDLLEIYEDRFRRHFDVKCFVSPKKLIADLLSGAVRHPDVIITDLRMAEIDGIEMIRALRKAGLQSPAILLSGNLDRESTELASGAGVNRIMDKPFKEAELRQRITELLPPGKFTSAPMPPPRS
jgi:DNA-binding response OmpR family regulator